MTTSAWPSSSDITPVTRSRISFCSGVLSTSIRLPPLRRRTASEIRLRPSSRSLVGSTVSRERVHLAEQVVAHPRHGGELHPVGLLVEADPEPEVGGSARRARARRGRCWARPAAAGRTASWNGSNWPSTLPPGSPAAAPTSAPVTREPTAGRQPGRRPFLSESLSTIGASTAEKPSALAWTQPARSTTSTGAVRSRGDQAGEVADQRGRPVGVVAQLGHGRRRPPSRSRPGRRRRAASRGRPRGPSRPCRIHVATLRVHGNAASRHGARAEQ